MSYTGDPLYRYGTVDMQNVQADVLSTFKIPVAKASEIKADTSGEKTILTSYWHNLKGSMQVNNILVKEVTAKPNGEIKENTVLSPKDITVMVTFEDNVSLKVSDFTIPKDAKAGEKITVTTKYGNAVLKMNPWTDVTVAYSEYGTVGKEPDAGKLSASVSFADGSSKKNPIGSDFICGRCCRISGRK